MKRILGCVFWGLSISLAALRADEIILAGGDEVSKKTIKQVDDGWASSRGGIP